MKYGQALKDMVLASGASQKEIAEKIGVTPSAIGQYFQSDEPSIGTVVRICHACDQRAYWFIASIELPKMPVEAFKIIEEIFFLPQKKREFFIRQMIEIKKLMDEIEKEANNK